MRAKQHQLLGLSTFSSSIFIKLQYRHHCPLLADLSLLTSCLRSALNANDIGHSLDSQKRNLQTLE